jgi:hypothetical protein
MSRERDLAMERAPPCVVMPRLLAAAATRPADAPAPAHSPWLVLRLRSALRFSGLRLAVVVLQLVLAVVVRTLRCLAAVASTSAPALGYCPPTVAPVDHFVDLPLLLHVLHW